MPTTVIIPSVSLGNVPQLALDLLLHTYPFELVRSLEDTCLSPFVGPMDYASNTEAPSGAGIATACQLFRYGDVYAVQVRSPPLPGCRARFAAELHESLRASEITDAEIVVVGSALADVSRPGAGSGITEVREPVPLPESGFLAELLRVFANRVALVSWVHEGDNTPDAVSMARAIAGKVALDPIHQLVQPVSWEKLYGKSAPLGVENGLYT